MKRTKRSLMVILLIIGLVIFFFNLGSFRNPSTDLSFNEKLSVATLASIIVCFIVLPFIGKHKLIILRNFLRGLLIIAFIIIYFKMRNIFLTKESVILCLIIFTPAFLLSFCNFKRKRKELVG